MLVRYGHTHKTIRFGQFLRRGGGAAISDGPAQYAKLAGVSLFASSPTNSKRSTTRIVQEVCENSRG